jgi:glutamine amidotransferase
LEQRVDKMVAVIDYGMGNLASVSAALEVISVPHAVTNDPSLIESSDILILPGVGSFPKAMKNLEGLGLISVLKKAVKEDRKPIFGICLGMQLLAEWGEEEKDTPGLGFIPGKVCAIPENGLRIPHIGWNEIHCPEGSWIKPFEGKDFYFIHSYYFLPEDPLHISATVSYGTDLTASVRKENIFGTQFHPEKSQESGLDLLRHFFKIHA